MEGTREVLNPNGRSPYQRYRKTPWRYSDLLGKIGKARLEGHHLEADKLARSHSAAYGLAASRFVVFVPEEENEE